MSLIIHATEGLPSIKHEHFNGSDTSAAIDQAPVLSLIERKCSYQLSISTVINYTLPSYQSSTRTSIDTTTMLPSIKQECSHQLSTSAHINQVQALMLIKQEC